VTRALRFVADHYLLAPIGALVAIGWANTFGASYFRVAEMLAFGVNDVGMAFVLGVVAQEVVEAALPGGTLHPWRRAALPVIGAAGGVLGAVATYDAYIFSGDSRNLLQGWPVVSAVDIAFCYFIGAAIFGRGAALTFLLLLAIASDAIGLVLIACRFPVPDARAAAATLIVPAVWSAARLRRIRPRSMWAQVGVSGTLSWFALYWSGVHPALALLPIVPWLPHSARHLDTMCERDRARHVSPSHFEHVFRYPVQVVLFLFGLVNAGVLLKGFGDGTWGVLTASLVGRPAGILLAVGMGVAAGFELPRAVHQRDVVVIALATAPAFTFGLFFATAVLPVGPLLTELKIGAMATAGGALLSFGTARLLRVGRFGPTAIGRK
jgi:NhaA family Na+:H+ antiporter